MFTTITGSYISPGTMRVHFKKLAEQIGAPEARVHDLRHTYAMVSLENGDDIKTVQGNLGHATAAFTLDVYGHVSDRMKKESSSRMEEFIRGLTIPEDKPTGPIIKIVNRKIKGRHICRSKYSNIFSQ